MYPATQACAQSSRGRTSSSEATGSWLVRSCRMRRIWAWSPAVMSATEASVRNGSGRGVTGSGPSAVPAARPYTARAGASAVPSATLRLSASHSS